MDNPTVNLEDAMTNLFNSSVSGSGEDELLRIASEFAMQLSAKQVKILVYLRDTALTLRGKNGNKKSADRLEKFVENYLKYKRNNNSEQFVMRALDSISLRRLVNENTMKLNIQKQ